ncbi:hypothetical protein F5050DRAFT_1715074 [Lentinula boryana]|uniref:REJ domain-containing protein n=1 Tax=Lentinula boryana TaxID=40481 RepID=A0ABQ8Q2M1_9AGAR|nr:hypothetical protein F5050DRAFT_1715074 [Lentinula boryana]
MFIDSVLFARADTTTSSASSLTTSVSTSNSTPTSTTVTSSGSSSSSSSPSSSASSSTASTSTSASSSSSTSSSTQSTSITSSASSTSATASATSSQSSSSSDAKEIGAIVGGVIGGLVVLTLLSVVFTALRRKRRNAKKRPRGSVYLGNMDQNQLDTFLKQKPRTNVDSLHSSSTMPLLSLPQVNTTLQDDIATEYTDVPAPNSYRDYQPNAAQGNDQNGTGGESESGHSLFLPSPYSQHGHDGNGDDAPPELPQLRLMTPSLRPESQFYEPIPVQVGNFSMKALEESASGSRSSTPVSLSMKHGKDGVNTTSSPPVNEENVSL